VNKDLAVDAGAWTPTVTPDGKPARSIVPPARTLFQQLVDALDDLPTPPVYFPSISDLGIATVALALRYGSYLVVLVDPEKPVWKHAGREDVSAIDDSEMARINIEACAAVEQLMRLARKDRDAFRTLIFHAKTQLPTPQTRVTRDSSWHLWGLHRAVRATERASPENRNALANVWKHTGTPEVIRNPERALANVIVNACWRNGSSIEDIHAGGPAPEALPLLQRRIASRELARLMKGAAAAFADGMAAMESVLDDEEGSFEENVFAYYKAPIPLVPARWSFEENTRNVLLSGLEP
jgi:hypothetical protein